MDCCQQILPVQDSRFSYICQRLAYILDIPLEQRPAFLRLARVHLTALLTTSPGLPPAPEEIGAVDLSGRAVRGYQLRERIGMGSFAAVYRAVQPAISREVALKIILPQYASHPEFIRHFEREALLIASLEHPHIVPLYDFFCEPGSAYLVLRLLRGGDLRQRLLADSLPIEQVQLIFQQICSALITAHEHGVVHCDIKPANVFLDERGNAYLSDFSLSCILNNIDLLINLQGSTPGNSPRYRSPEQILNQPVTPRSDIYSLGILLFEMLTGQFYFNNLSLSDSIIHHLTRPLPSLAQLRPDLPAGLDAVIQHASAKDPQARFASANELAAAFNKAMNPK